MAARCQTNGLRNGIVRSRSVCPDPWWDLWSKETTMIDKTFVEKIRKQALEELPQIEDPVKREDELEDYINGMSNIELLELIQRSTCD